MLVLIVKKRDDPSIKFVCIYLVVGRLIEQFLHTVGLVIATVAAVRPFIL